ncbi:DgyrCDS10686 [Dimorphilus gyrociliatus]|uniref:DgyrCDS10686 n=1 Tax=Dimorphilus gyrociliatus TaxID=2664684 RepID=A0A7I8W2C3_9ANNE|nr:DgyrCDS10686 [Dimorphilus gyrociliatus]
MKLFAVLILSIQLSFVFLNPAFFIFDSDLRHYSNNAAVQFSDVAINKQNFYTNNAAHITEPGYYFSALNAATPKDGEVNFRHNFFYGDKYVIQPPNANDVVTSSRISMYEHKSGSSSRRENIRSFKSSTTISDTISKTTSWLAFKYNTDNIFYAGYTEKNGNNMIFNDVRILKGIGYGQNALRIAKSGLYFFAITLGTTNSSNNEVEIYINGQALFQSVGKIVRNNDESGEYIMSSTRSWIFQLKEKDEVSLRGLKGNYVDKYHTSFLMFRLDSSNTKPSFSAVRKAGWLGFGALNPIEFDTTLAIMGNYWNARENQYEIQTSGLYFLSVTGGKYRRCKLEMEVLVNNELKGELLNHNTGPGDENTNTMNMLLELKDGDVLSFSSPNSACFDDSYYLTSFSIFYVSS